MAYCILISRDQEFLDSAKQFVESKTIYEPLNIWLPQGLDRKSRLEVFQFLQKRICCIPSNELLHSVVLVYDWFLIEQSNPAHIDGRMSDNDQVSHLYGMLMLSFPELRFLYVNAFKENENILSWIDNECDEKKSKQPFISLFDYNDVRNKLRKNINEMNKTPDGRSINLDIRVKTARVVEDEISYAFFHSYLVYKRKHTCQLYTSLNHLSQGGREVDQQIQDKCLGFTDKDSSESISDFGKRFKEFAFLCQRKYDCIITTDGDDLEEMLEGLPMPTEGEFVFLNKPSKGLYDIEERLGLDSEEDKESGVNGSNLHSAPGMLALISECLIARAEMILTNARNVVDSIHAAVLALEAKELLNGLTPTLALQAYTLQQRAEVTAECMFVGTEYNIMLEPRFKDIKLEVSIISKAFASSEQKRVALNTRISLAETLSGLYGVHKQFEEELACLNVARSLKFELWRDRAQFPRPFNKLCKWFLNGLDWAMRDMANLGKALIMVQFFFGLVYYIMLKFYQKSFTWSLDLNGFLYESRNVLDALLSATKYFFTCESTSKFSTVFENATPWGNVVLACQGFLALSSLSLFMAMIFLRISRK